MKQSKRTILITLVMSICVALSTALFWGCERRPLFEGPYSTAIIPIRAYWDMAAQNLPEDEWNIQNATVLVYDSLGNLYLEKQFESLPQYAETWVELELGKYSIVVFNELRGQVRNIGIRGHGQLSTLQAYSMPAPLRYNTQSRADGDHMVTQPGHLAVSIASLNVTREVITRTRALTAQNTVTRTAQEEALMNLHPVRKTSSVQFVAHIQKLNNALMPALVDMRNMTEGYEFATDRNCMVPATIQFTMNNRQYLPGSSIDGTIRETVTTFGLPGERISTEDLEHNVILDFSLKLIDGKTIVVKSLDITSQIEVNVEENKAIKMNVVVDVGSLPEVEGIGGTTELVKWEDEDINIEL